MSDTMKEWLEDSGGVGYPGFRFANLKDGIKGRVVEKPRIVEVDSLRNPGTMERKLVIVIEAEKVKGTYNFKDPDSGVKSTPAAEVGGTYSVWIQKGLGAIAVNDAIKAANADGISAGDTFSIAYVDNKNTGKVQPAKVYKCELVPSKPSVGVDSLFGDDEPSDDEDSF